MLSSIMQGAWTSKTLLALIFSAFAGFQTLQQITGPFLYKIFVDIWTISVSVNDNDDIFEQVLKWMTKTLRHRLGSNQLARTNVVNPLDKRVRPTKDKETGIYSLRHWKSSDSILFEPAFGTHLFMYHGWPFLFTRRGNSTGNMSVLGACDAITITCLFWWSPIPVHAIIDEARIDHYNHQKAAIEVYQPASRSSRQKGRPAWKSLQTKPCRSLDTLDLDVACKDKIQQDINNFLSEGTYEAYAAFGKPYHRGYCLHGPPGTGKSSLIQALAGIIDASIYYVSVNNASLTNSEFLEIISEVKPYSFIVIEDIDVGGFGSSRILGRHNNNLDGEQEGISLQGLLNALDGPAAPEGQIFWITTNYLERLDEALLRPGRMDMITYFPLPSREHIKSSFVRRYMRSICALWEDSLNSKYQEKLNLETLDDLASKFADTVSDHGFTLPEIHQLFEAHGYDPYQAYSKAEAWKQEMLACKTSRAKDRATSMAQLAERAVHHQTQP